MKPSWIIKIIEACGANGVEEFKCDEFSLSFTCQNDLQVANMIDKNTEVEENYHHSISSDPASFTPSGHSALVEPEESEYNRNNVQPTAESAGDGYVMQDLLENLALTDPEEYERIIVEGS